LHHRIFPILTKISDDDTSTEARQEGVSIQDPSGRVLGSLDIQLQVLVRHSVHLRIPDVRTREDGNLELLTPGPTPRHPMSVYEKAPYYPSDPSTSHRVYSGLNPYAGLYYLSAMTSRGRPIRKTILQSSAGASSSSSSEATPDQDSIEDYLEIRSSACWNPVIEA
jgi:hypothetical protein